MPLAKVIKTAESKMALVIKSYIIGKDYIRLNGYDWLVRMLNRKEKEKSHLELTNLGNTCIGKFANQDLLLNLRLYMYGILEMLS